MSIQICPNCNAYRGIKVGYHVLRREHYTLRCEQCGLFARGKNLDQAMQKWNKIAWRPTHD